MADPNTSATGGYLAPLPEPAPLWDRALESFLQAIIVGVTGLPGNLVRPAWQPEPPNLPPRATNWAALGITNVAPDTFAVELHDAEGDGFDELQRHETISLLTSFYGPDAQKYCALFRDGIQISQNRAVLTMNGMGLVDTGDALRIPVLDKELWINRVDMRWTIRRAVQRYYPVLNLLDFTGGLIAEDTPVPPGYIKVPFGPQPPAQPGRLNIDFVLNESALS